MNSIFLTCLTGKKIYAYITVLAFSLFLLQCHSDSDGRDPIVLEWRGKFYEVAAASYRFRKSESMISNYDRIFPQDFKDLHKWSNPHENVYLISEADWVDINDSIEFIYFSMDEIHIGTGLEVDSCLVKDTEILYKEFVGNDGKKYRISLTLGGIVKITIIN